MCVLKEPLGQRIIEIGLNELNAAFVNFLYTVSGPLVAPFQGIFGNGGSKANSFETADLVAIAVYAVIGWGVVMLIRIITAPRGTKPATS